MQPLNSSVNPGLTRTGIAAPASRNSSGTPFSQVMNNRLGAGPATSNAAKPWANVNPGLMNRAGAALPGASSPGVSSSNNAFFSTLSSPTTSLGFAPMSGQNVSQSLSALKLPLTEGNLTLAKSMVECGAPLTRENVASLKSTLAQLPSNVASSPGSVGATWFLQSNQLPVTPQNVVAMGNFISAHPQVGQQLFSLQGEIKRLCKDPAGLNQKTLEVLNQVPGLLGELAMHSNSGQKSSKRTGSKLFDLAKQAGIETNLALVGGGESDWELLELMRAVRDSIGEQAPQLSRLFTLTDSLEENLQALRLLNQAKPDPGLAFYYLQVPLRLDSNDYAEVWIRYRLLEDGRRVVELHDTRLEFLINTEYLGTLTCCLDISGQNVAVLLSCDCNEICEYVREYLPCLAERITGLGWIAQKLQATLSSLDGNEEILTHSSLQERSLGSMETVDVEA